MAFINRDYLPLPFDEARVIKWESGKAYHRQKNPDATFQGERCEEAFQECLDLYNYLEELERHEGVSFFLQKLLVKFIAFSVKVIHTNLRHAHR